MNTKKIGDALEYYVEERFKELEPKTYRTIASGAIFGDQDIKGPTFLIQTKKRNTEGFTISKKVWDELESAAYSDVKIPVLVTENIQGKKLLHIDVDEFIDWAKNILLRGGDKV